MQELTEIQARVLECDPPLVREIPRQAGQKEGRYAHLLCGEPDIPVCVRPSVPSQVRDSLEQRLSDLEVQLESVRQRLSRLESGSTDD